MHIKCKFLLRALCHNLPGIIPIPSLKAPPSFHCRYCSSVTGCSWYCFHSTSGCLLWVSLAITLAPILKRQKSTHSFMLLGTLIASSLFPEIRIEMDLGSV